MTRIASMNKVGIARRALLGGAAATAVCAGAGLRPARSQTELGPFVCPPCGCDADGREYPGPGSCPACGMTLEPRDPPFEPTELARGASLFVTSGGPAHEDARIGVHTYMPASFTARSPVLLVIPGDGRNGADYRDTWIEAAESFGLLIGALTYAETDYDFAAYQMGGVIKDLEVRNLPIGPNGETPAIIQLDDDDISFSLNPERPTWLFQDFDRIFDLIVTASGSRRTAYDMFGHSAGGQILHRAALFNPGSRADRIVAANAGQYTQPDLDLPPLAGMKDTGMSEASLAQSFASNLTLLLGENDNNANAGGTLLRTPTLDRFGIYRLERGRRFFAAARERSQSLRSTFDWTLQTVAGVGHDFRAMSRAAALHLYG